MQYKISKLLHILAFAILLMSKGFAQEMPPAVVVTDQVVSMTMAPSMWVSGTVIGRYDSRIAAEVEGLIVSIPEVGDHFNKGDEIARIRSRSYQLERDEIASQIAPIQADLDFYTAESKRLEKLANKNNAAKNRLDELRASRDKAKAEIRRIRARLAMADDTLSKTIIKAPFDGVIAERMKSPGEQISEGEMLFRFVDIAQSEIQVWIPEQGLAYVKTGEELEVRYKDVRLHGDIRSVIPVADSRSRMYEVRLANPDDYWPIGHAVQVQVPNGKKRKVLAVNRDALVVRSQGVSIYRVSKENTAEMIRVKTGAAHHEMIEIMGNVQDGDNVIIRGNERLYPGAKVNPQNKAPES